MDRLPPLRLLTTFDAVSRLGSMQQAADALNVTPPAITQAVRALEEHIGVPLLDRSVKPARLNAAGERLAQSTRSGLGQIAEAIEELRLMAGLSGRRLTVSCTIGMATYWLMPRLPDFYLRFDDIAVNVQAPPSDLPALSQGIDVALRYGRGDWRDGQSRKLFDEMVCPVAIPSLIAMVAAAPDQLCSAPLIHVRAPAAHHWEGWPNYLAALGLPRATGPAHLFDNYIHAVQAALSGRGIMLGWRSITSQFVAEGRLTELSGGQLDLGTAYYITTPEGSLTKGVVADFMGWIETLDGAA